MSTLFVVATPIGNLQELSPRAIEVLRQAPVVAAEDTRVSRKLLTMSDSKARIISYNENSPPGRLVELLQLLESGDVAMVSDAGTPGISDPGAALVSEAAKAGHIVSPIAGPSAVTAALSVSGFSADTFIFLGFLPRKTAERRRTLSSYTSPPVTLVLLEAPHRLRDTLDDINYVVPDRQLAVCRELTKLHEEVFRGTTDEAIQHFTQPRGEFVIVIAPGDVVVTEATDEQIAEAASAAIASGLSGRDAVEQVMTATGAARSRVYPAVLAAQARLAT
ncbi:MAG: 16S rRNA (cytidine(1402)-2'-O)-methyltransferase [Chloroflexi bacterium]|nr:16S rRNA (cytidine(1402)-2'-O)-methyltransferase [Chloroflexota bacterium]